MSRKNSYGRMNGMEIAIVSGDSLKVKGKTAQVLIDPSSDMAKTEASAILLLSSQHAHVSKVEGYRLVIEGPGEYEISGIKISAFELHNHLAYEIHVDGVELLLVTAQSLKASLEKVKEYHVVVVRSDASLNQSVITTLSPQVVILYGEKAKDEAKLLGKDTASTIQKYQTTVEKLPEEMEVVVLG